MAELIVDVSIDVIVRVCDLVYLNTPIVRRGQLHLEATLCEAAQTRPHSTSSETGPLALIMDT